MLPFYLSFYQTHAAYQLNFFKKESPKHIEIITFTYDHYLRLDDETVKK